MKLCESCPIGSMYGIFTYIYHKNQPNVGKYTIHGSYGCDRAGVKSSAVFSFSREFLPNLPHVNLKWKSC